MALETVVKTEILCHKSHVDQVLRLLERSGMVHLADADPATSEGFTRVDGGSLEEVRELRVELERAIQFLSDFVTGKGRPELAVTREALEKALGDPSARAVSREAAIVSAEIIETEQQIRDLGARRALAVKWAVLPCRFDMVGREGAFTVFAGTLPGSADAEPLLHEEFSLTHVSLHPEDMVTAVAHLTEAKAFGERLVSMGYVPGDFTGLSATPADELSRLDEMLEAAGRKLAQCRHRARQLAEKVPQLQMMFDAAGLFMTRQEAASLGVSSPSVLVLHAWVREKDVPCLKAELEKLAAAGMEVVEPLQGETPPVFLSEHATVDPYLLLTDMFGRPAGSDPDPTPLFAPFYALFFGICIGDAGYGAALVLGSALGWWLTKRRGGNTRLFRLIFQGGLASILSGVFLGGWFGMEFTALPPLLQAPANILNGLVPGYSPGKPGFSVSNQFLYLTLGLGLVQLSWGVLVNLPKRLRQGEGVAAVLEQGGWMLAIAGLFPWLFNRYLLNGALYDISGPADRFFLLMLGAGALLIFIMGGRSAGSIGGRMGLGAYATYGIVNLLGDVLSYSRLFALALSSAIIAQVINEIAGMVAGSAAGIGLVLAGVVLLAGHAFNLAMAVLSGFIHTARLQFVEFFGKFYDGTGVPFSPLRFEPRFVRIGKTQ